MKESMLKMMYLSLMVFFITSALSLSQESTHRLLDTETFMEMESVGIPIISADGTMLAFTSFIPDTKSVLTVKLPQRLDGAKWAAPAVIVDRLTWASDGRGPVPKGYSHIFTVDARLGGTPRQVTSCDFSHSDPEWSRDGKKIYFSAIREPDAEYQNGDSDIYVVDLQTLQVETLTDRT